MESTGHQQEKKTKNIKLYKTQGRPDHLPTLPVIFYYTVSKITPQDKDFSDTTSQCDSKPLFSASRSIHKTTEIHLPFYLQQVNN